VKPSSKVTSASLTAMPKQTRVRDDHSRALQNRLESFKELDQRRTHYSLAVQEAFSANEREDFHLIGTLADSVQVDAQWERAVEGTFESSLQSFWCLRPMTRFVRAPG